MLPWTDYDDLSVVDLWHQDGSYIAYYISCRYVYPMYSCWEWNVYECRYGWMGAREDVVLKSGREVDRITAKKESEYWFQQNVGLIG
jgi:hypothetical protein